MQSATDGRFATQADLEESIEVVIAGYQKKRPRPFRRRKKLIVSYHEVGHALVAARRQTDSAPVHDDSRSFPVPPVLWATPCRWMSGEHYPDDEGRAGEQDRYILPAAVQRRS